MERQAEPWTLPPGVRIVAPDGSLIDPALVGLYSAYFCFVDRKSSGTNGGTFTNGTYLRRDLNTVASRFAAGGASGGGGLDNSQITLPPGTYDCQIRCPAISVGAHKARLYDVTHGVALLPGSSESTRAVSAVQTVSLIVGAFTLTETSVLEIQHRCTATMANTGFGVASSFDADDEVYTSAQFWRRAVAYGGG